jgi:hypothetical protein
LAGTAAPVDADEPILPIVFVPEGNEPLLMFTLTLELATAPAMVAKLPPVSSASAEVFRLVPAFAVTVGEPEIETLGVFVTVTWAFPELSTLSVWTFGVPP